MKGLEPAGQSWNSTSLASILTSRVPAVIQSLFEQRLHGEGMGLYEVAVFAATLSDFVHSEALSDVVDLYEAFSLSTTELATETETYRVIKGYVLQLLDGVTKIKSKSGLRELEWQIIAEYPGWNDLMMWVFDMRKTSSSDR